LYVVILPYPPLLWLAAAHEKVLGSFRSTT